MLLTLADFEEAARAKLSEADASFVSGAAGEGRTVVSNARAFDRLALLPRVLVDVSVRSTATTVLGHDVGVPVLLAPSAMHRIVHPDGELATVRGAGAANTIMVLSLASSVPVEDVTAAATSPVWFQAYVGKDRSRTAEVLQRAEAAGCTALVVTVDAPVLGGRTMERRAGFEIRPEWFAEGHTPMYGLAEPVAARHAATEIWDPSLTWNDLAWLRGATALPVLLKGVLRGDDASRAVAEGVDGVIVSNHGGRQLDSAIAGVVALPEVVEAVAGSGSVVVDGGIRRGTDVLKALALGADAVMVGRPVLWGLSVDGAAGVERVLRILADELEVAMALCGVRSVDEITADFVRRG
jgi:4-hydroxymandelate oxidase